MNQNTSKHATEFSAHETKPSENTMEMCPMGKMCAGMMKGKSFGWLLVLPGILLIVFGVLIVVEPKVLVWFIAAGAIVLGIAILIMAGFNRRTGAPLRR